MFPFDIPKGNPLPEEMTLKIEEVLKRFSDLEIEPHSETSHLLKNKEVKKP